VIDIYFLSEIQKQVTKQVKVATVDEERTKLCYLTNTNTFDKFIAGYDCTMLTCTRKLTQESTL